jgi:leader peptidase (prepilin peptidase)/N-methyltransferase
VLDFLTAIWFGIIGACIGSFLNVVAYRMPRGMSIVWEPSHCPACGRPIRPRDNVPVLGWLTLRGRCRDCGKAISPRYAIVEATMGAVFFALAYVELFSGGANLPSGPTVAARGSWETVWNPQWPLIVAYAFHAAMLCVLMCAALISHDEEIVPYRLIGFGGVAVLAAIMAWRFDHALPLPGVGGVHAGVEAAVGLAGGVSIALAMSQGAPPRDIAQRAMCRRNLALALGAVGGFLGLSPLLAITVVAAAATLVLGAATGQASRNFFFRVAPSSIFAASLVHLAFWKQIASWSAS